MEISKAVSSILHAPFSDQTHLQFYGHGSSSLTHSKLCFNTPCRSLPSVASKPVKVPLRALCNSACNGPMELVAEQALMKEIADLKLQMKQKKKELKSRMKDEKENLKMQLKEGKKMKKQKGVQEKQKTKMKCESESSSSSSESSDEDCVSVSMKTLRQGQSMLEDARVNIEGGLGIAASVCASDAIDGFSSNVLFQGNDAMNSCIEESSRVFSLGRDNAEICSPMASMGSFNGCIPIQKVNSELAEVQKHADTCGLMSPCKSMSDSQLSNAFPSLHVSNRIEVCAGGKCKKAGSEQLLLALQGQIPGSSNVEAVPCKCMGKCAMAINVRVHKEDTNPQHHSPVSVEDASLILGHHFGLGRPSVGLPSLAP